MRLTVMTNMAKSLRAAPPEEEEEEEEGVPPPADPAAAVAEGLQRLTSGSAGTATLCAPCKRSAT